ncbi:MAG: Tetratricopeptide 1 repeat-containing protein [Symbiobacteriaceae bacterium]|nr:Tetratricopeptide 1 repeat-containing protein [Symbiobacteriaceae bacterium]
MMCALLVLAMALAGCGAKKEASPELTPEKAREMASESLNLVQKGQYDEANKALEQIVKVEQGDAKNFLLLGITRFQKQDYHGAHEAYDKAIALDAKMVEAYQGKANVFRNQKNLKDAEVWYRKAWQVQPQYFEAYTELALQLKLANRIPEAVAVMQEAVTNNPNMPQAFAVLGFYQVENGQKDEARKSFEAALKLDPNHKDAKAGLDSLK